MKMNLDTQSYVSKRKVILRRIEEAQKELDELYGNHFRELLTDEEAGIVCIDVEVEKNTDPEISPDFQKRHDLTFKADEVKLKFKLSCGTWSEDRGSCPFYADTAIEVYDSDELQFTFELDKGSNNQWFLDSNASGDLKDLTRDVSDSCEEYVPLILACIELIVKNSDELEWEE